MKTIKLLLVALLVITFSQVSAQTADEIIASYYENTGGLENWKKLEGITMSAKVNQGGMEIPLAITQLKSGKQMTVINFQGKEIKQGVFDGEVLWSDNFMTQKAEKSDKETTDNMKIQAMDFPDAFLNYKEKGYTLELLGKENLDGTETFKLKLTKKPLIVEGKEEENSSIYYFDAENFVPLVVHTEVRMGPQKGMISEIKMSDYQEVDGLYFPFSLTQGIKDQAGQGITIDKIELNPTIDDDAFKFPEEAVTEDKKN
ncbi:outer membrane lipoprotein-sorting protein [Pontimicrobium sp. SW4]|uniref:Outer membrane lipoprotein-sorting protein n=1 Tax=Pontimicrobium sp. SW4 TaxID=3153519 RepID=A0AAU7BWC0_9FLAO